MRSRLRQLLRHLGMRLPYGVVGLGLLLALVEALKIVAGFDKSPNPLQITALSLVAFLSFVMAFINQLSKKALKVDI